MAQASGMYVVTVRLEAVVGVGRVGYTPVDHVTSKPAPTNASTKLLPGRRSST